MKEYENTILLKDYDDEKVDAIIFTNESKEIIQDAINKAKNQFYELIEKEELPVYINCEYEYIWEYLTKNYDIDYIETWEHNEVYY